MDRISASIYSGSLSEIVFVVGFNFGKTVSPAKSQFKSSDESLLAQNSLSSFSFLKTGILLTFFMINLSFTFTHISCRDDTNFIISNSEDDKQQSVKIEDIKKNIEQLEKGLDKNPNILIVDGFPFEKAEEDELAKWKALAEEKQLAIWFSATLHRDNLEMDENGIPAPVNKFASLFEVIIMLRPVRDYIEFDLLKSHENSKEKRLALKLDPITMLISNHRV